MSAGSPLKVTAGNDGTKGGVVLGCVSKLCASHYYFYCVLGYSLKLVQKCGGTLTELDEHKGLYLKVSF